MKTVTFFYMPGCPYCAMARRALRKLREEEPEFGSVEINEIDETAEPELADSYDYYYVPAFYIGKEKYYEARPGAFGAGMTRGIRRVLQAALE